MGSLSTSLLIHFFLVIIIFYVQFLYCSVVMEEAAYQKQKCQLQKYMKERNSFRIFLFIIHLCSIWTFFLLLFAILSFSYAPLYHHNIVILPLNTVEYTQKKKDEREKSAQVLFLLDKYGQQNLWVWVSL